MENIFRVMLIRHGETKENRERRYCGGGSDSPLSPEGMEQILLYRKLGCYNAALRHPGRLTAVSSDLRRAVETLDLILYGEIGEDTDHSPDSRDGMFRKAADREEALSSEKLSVETLPGGMLLEETLSNKALSNDTLRKKISREETFQKELYRKEMFQKKTGEALFRAATSNLREIEFGIFEGKTYEQLRMNPYYRRWISGDNEANMCPGGESGLLMKRRVLFTYKKILSMMAAGEETEPEEGNAFPEKMRGSVLLLVTHGGPAAAIMQDAFPHAGRNRYEWQPACGCGYMLEYIRENRELQPVRYSAVGPE